MATHLSEQAIQKRIIDKMEADGWYCIKLIKTNKNGIPDICCTKPNDVIFIEVKKPGGKLSKLQEYRIKELNDKGIKAIVSYGES